MPRPPVEVVKKIPDKQADRRKENKKKKERKKREIEEKEKKREFWRWIKMRCFSVFERILHLLVLILVLYVFNKLIAIVSAVEDYSSTRFEPIFLGDVLHNPQFHSVELDTFGIGEAFTARLSLAEIKSAAKGFCASGKEVTIKRFNLVDPLEQDIAAVAGCFKHHNLVQLVVVGWCCEGDESLSRRFLHFSNATNRTSFSLTCWERARIIVPGVASALTHLHDVCETQIIHRDAKESNVMLDGDYDTKLGDFALAERNEGKFSFGAQHLAAMAGRFEHQNLVQLVGWCCEGDDLVLASGFVPDDSLSRRFLHFNKATNRTSFSLTWWERTRIIVPGVVPALTHLHDICETQIIHRDAKASNIMRDGDYDAKLDDFEFAERNEGKFSCGAQDIAAVAGRFEHQNLFQLLGWCCEGDDLVLASGVVPDGSLARRFLHFNKETNGTSFSLTWWERTRIIVPGVVSALTHLHDVCETQIINRDAKASNIMRDGDCDSKLGDFGLAELNEGKFSCGTQIETVPDGTMGYLASEHVHTGVPTEEIYVYSFGVVVSEVAPGRISVENYGCVLVDKVWEMWSKGKLMEAIDCRLLGRFEVRGMERMLMVGLSCVHPDSKKGQKMKETERILKRRCSKSHFASQKTRDKNPVCFSRCITDAGRSKCFV